ncbi:hypothetical protein [Pseudomonas denitrificans (nom. rej.)]|uniref:Uncharacterized protein n=1 Tax=Pseudomonas denitrificans TaxID=43306 RepID=A0A9X7R6F0_PSEDE|nr:hypothetical protein [Pseudomonas denitrificans (nom. rej.)]QEY74483.1 hypothetical protein F1C79_24285 [Pseudomonas denitrificans (nom. rej.)]
MSSYSRYSIEDAFANGDEKGICDAILLMTFNDPDWKWVQNKLLDFLSSPSESIRGVSVTCLGHLARIHGVLEKEKVINKLSSLLADKDVSGQVESAMEDIEMFL